MTAAPTVAVEADRQAAGRPPEARRALLRNGYALMANTAVTGVLGLAYWVLAARLFPPDALGAGSAAVSALLFVAGVSQLNLMGALTRFLPVAGDRAGALLLCSYGTAAAVAVGLGTLTVATAGWWSPPDSPLRAGGWFAVAFVAGVVAWCLFVLQDSALTALNGAVWVPVENGAFGLAKIAALVALAGGSAAAIFTAWTLPAVMCLAPVNVFLFRRAIPRHVARTGGATAAVVTRRGVARFVGGDYVGSVFAQALLTLMPLVVVGMLGSEAGGRFYVPWVVATTLDLLAGNLATSLIVESSRDERLLGANTRTVLQRAGVLLVPLAAGVVLLAPLLLQVFGSGYASESSALMRLLGVATVPRALSSIYIGVCRVQRRVGRIAAVQAAQAVIVLGVAALLLPGIGIAGAGWAAVAGQVAVALYVMPKLRDVVSA